MSGDLLAILDAADAETALTVAPKPKRKRRAKPNAAAQFAKAIDPPKPARPALPESVRVDSEARQLKNRKAEREEATAAARAARAGTMPPPAQPGSRIERMNDEMALLVWSRREAIHDRKWGNVATFSKAIDALADKAFEHLENAPMDSLDAEQHEERWRTITVPSLPVSYLRHAVDEYRRRTAVLAEGD